MPSLLPTLLNPHLCVPPPSLCKPPLAGDLLTSVQLDARTYPEVSGTFEYFYQEYEESTTWLPLCTIVVQNTEMELSQEGGEMVGTGTLGVSGIPPPSDSSPNDHTSYTYNTTHYIPKKFASTSSTTSTLTPHTLLVQFRPTQTDILPLNAQGDKIMFLEKKVSMLVMKRKTRILWDRPPSLGVCIHIPLYVPLYLFLYVFTPHCIHLYLLHLIFVLNHPHPYT